MTVANLSVLRDDRTRAVRFSTVTAICRALDCQPSTVLSVSPISACSEEGIPVREAA